MPRRTKTKPKKNAALKISSAPKRHKDMRFSVSLVVLIAFLVTAALLLLVSLIGQHRVKAIGANLAVSRMAGTVAKKTAAPAPAPTTFLGLNVEFQLAIPDTWKGWAYRTGEVKSPIDDALSDEYVKIYLPETPASNAGADSPNLDSRYRDMITIMNFSLDEWKALEKKCNRGNSNMCDEMGKKLADATCPGFAEDTPCVYSYTIQPNCGPFEDRCNEVDKIMESFQLK